MEEGFLHNWVDFWFDELKGELKVFIILVITGRADTLHLHVINKVRL